MGGILTCLYVCPVYAHVYRLALRDSVGAGDPKWLDHSQDPAQAGAPGCPLKLIVCSAVGVM
jgi:hypothetical protein